MSKLYLIGGILWLGGMVMILFQAVSSMMVPGDIVWKSLSIVDLVSADYLLWIDSISWPSIQIYAKFLTTMPLYILLLSLGSLSYIVGGVVHK